ncbi:MAG TPA: hypothetical protein VNM50_05900, partial [Chloroflexota bacterium]|nr:hypothetical protein [Chloroflexota bacterium]
DIPVVPLLQNCLVPPLPTLPRCLRLGQLVALPVPDLPMVEQFLLAYRRTHRFTPLAASLLAFIRAEARAVAGTPTPAPLPPSP